MEGARPYLEANRLHWDEVARRHPDTDFYRPMLERVRAGGSSLHPFETAELGEVAGRSLLHLQCHIGTESVSLALRGAAVTAVDFSSDALAQVAALAGELGVRVRCVEANVLELRDVLDDTFDIVYTSWGVLTWLPDLARWAQVVAASLRPGGVFYIAEFHPTLWLFDDTSAELRVGYSYFRDAEPVRDEHGGTYADRDARLEHQVTYAWPFPLGDIVTGLVDAGLRIEFLHEHETCPARFVPALAMDPNGPPHWYHMPPGAHRLPLSFSLRASRD